jgi:3-phosphoshikimate 1-carboxyvinyltransferase
MVEALRCLGFEVENDEAAGALTVVGLGGRIPRSSAALHVGNAGTVARFLTAMLALHPDGHYILDGDAPMRKRPMGGLLNALAGQGAVATALGGSPAFPFALETHGLKGGHIEVDASESSQILSALLLVAPFAAAATTICLSGKTVSEPFVEMTLRMMAQFGGGASSASPGTYVCGSCGPYQAPSASYAIEPDATAASYFLALPVVANATVRLALPFEASLQGDTAFARILQKLGLPLAAANGVLEVASPQRQLPGGDFDFNDISDTFPTLAALAPLLEGPLTIRRVAHARKQETDRVLAVAAELEKLGQRIEPSAATLRANLSIGDFTIFPDRQKMRALTRERLVHIHTYEDHRIAMSFGILGSHDLHGDGRPWLAIEDPACCAKTFPDFFDVLSRCHA